MSRRKSFSLVFGLVLVFSGWVAAVDLPYTFSPGQEIKSSEMNANFGALKDAIDALEAEALRSQEGVLAYAFYGWSANPRPGKWTVIYSYNSTGADVISDHVSAGVADITFRKIDLYHASIQVTAMSETVPGVCVLGSSPDDDGIDDTVRVRCFDLSAGASLADIAFVITVIK